MISIIPVDNIPIIKTIEDFWDAIDTTSQKLENDDILVVAHTPWSRVSGLIYTLDDIEPSQQAIKLAEELEKDPRHVEVMLKESESIVKTGRKVIVTENKAGVVCANGGIDQSNAGIGKLLAVPHNPDDLAHRIRDFIKKKTDKPVAVIISDTVGRALRRAAVNIGIGVAGMMPKRSEVGKKDLFGYSMRVSEVAIIDEIASAAELVQGQTDEGRPFVIIRGLSYEKSEQSSARDLNRPANERIFM